MKIYPLQTRFFILGIYAALLGCVLSFSPLVGLAFFVFCSIGGLLWRSGEPPILAFCIMFQCLGFLVGIIYYRATGAFPGGDTVGDYEAAVLFSLLGLLTVVAGLRAALAGFHWPLAHQRCSTENPPYDTQRLFWWVIVLYSADWVLDVNPNRLSGGIIQLANHVLAFRAIFFCLLIKTIGERRRDIRLGIIAFLFVLLPQLVHQHALIIGVFSLALVAMLGKWDPWSVFVGIRHRSKRAVFTIGLAVLLLGGWGILWQGGLKGAWRGALSSGEAGTTAIQKVRHLSTMAQKQADELQLNKAAVSLAERFATGFYFSHVLNRVPTLVPHENGTLTFRAFSHVLMPRFLFPNKPSLGSNSWLVNKYAGFAAAGEESGTSIGLSYMAEWYVDFGITGMFVALFCWGVFIGILYSAILVISPSHDFGCAAAIVLVLDNLATDGEIAYTLGGLLQRFLIFAVILCTSGHWIERQLLRGRSLYSRAFARPSGA